MEQTGVPLDFLAFFTADKVGKTGLTDMTVDVRKLDGTALVTGGAAVAVGGGFYRYRLPASFNTAKDLIVAVFKTADTTVDQQHQASMWQVGTGSSASGVGAYDWWWRK